MASISVFVGLLLKKHGVGNHWIASMNYGVGYLACMVLNWERFRS